MATLGLLPRFMVVEKPGNSCFARYVDEDGELKSYLQCNATYVTSPQTKLAVEAASDAVTQTGLVHIRCCYSNKYWTRLLSSSASSDNTNWIVATATAPDEDLSSSSCTLFEPILVDKNGTWPSQLRVRLRHAQLGFYLTAKSTGDTTTLCLQAVSAVTDPSDNDIFAITDWETLVIMPSLVAFKGDNGKYLAAQDANNIYLHYNVDDIGDRRVRHRIETAERGQLVISNIYMSKLWRNQPDWIQMDSFNYTGKENYVQYCPVKVGESTIALRSMSNNNYLKRLSSYDNTDCLDADNGSIETESQMEVVELVDLREVYDVTYRLSDAIIYDTYQDIFMGSATATNDSDDENSVTVQISYTDTWTGSWSNSISLTTGITFSFSVTIEDIATEGFEIRKDFNQTYTWGQEASDEQQTTASYTAVVPPKSQVVVKMLATKGTCDIPFTYTQRDTTPFGQQDPVQKLDGIYTGANCYNYYFQESPPTSIS